jgi:hypothetical protein
MPQRKRRLPKPWLPVGFLKLEQADWKRLENAFGHIIPDKARGEIITATKRMLRRSEAEHHQRPLSETIEHITRLKKAANNLLAAWTASGLPSASIHFAEEAINQELSDATDDITFDEFHDHLMLFAGACTRASARATSIAVQGTTRQAWADWIRDLRDDICPRYELPTGARKDSDKSSKSSPFVSFVWEFQRGIDPEYQRTPASKQALAKAINQVKRFRTHTRFGTKRARPKSKKSRNHRR